MPPDRFHSRRIVPEVFKIQIDGVRPGIQNGRYLFRPAAQHGQVRRRVRSCRTRRKRGKDERFRKTGGNGGFPLLPDRLNLFHEGAPCLVEDAEREHQALRAGGIRRKPGGTPFLPACRAAVPELQESAGVFRRLQGLCGLHGHPYSGQETVRGSPAGSGACQMEGKDGLRQVLPHFFQLGVQGRIIRFPELLPRPDLAPVNAGGFSVEEKAVSLHFPDAAALFFIAVLPGRQ